MSTREIPVMAATNLWPDRKKSTTKRTESPGHQRSSSTLRLRIEANEETKRARLYLHIVNTSIKPSTKSQSTTVSYAPEDLKMRSVGIAMTTSIT
jgi:hypothetical protein